jgi:hypothetical protein
VSKIVGYGANVPSFKGLRKRERKIRPTPATGGQTGMGRILEPIGTATPTNTKCDCDSGSLRVRQSLLRRAFSHHDEFRKQICANFSRS